MKVNYAIFSGVSAAAASLCGKLCGLPIFEGFFPIRVIFFCLMILCNAGVWTFFVKALQRSKSSLTATVISASSNYLLSAVTGFLVFGEITTLLWWAGMGFILCGLLLILSDANDVKVGKTKKSQ